MNNKKSQAAVTDLFVAIAIFITLVTITTATWNLYNTRLNSRVLYDDMVIKTYQISDVLLKTPGEPSNWETFNFQTQIGEIRYVGLSHGWNYVPIEKTDGLSSLNTINATAIKEMFNIGQYEFGFRILNASGSTLYQIGNFGIKAKYTVTLARNMIYDASGSTTPIPVTAEVSLSL